MLDSDYIFNSLLYLDVEWHRKRYRHFKPLGIVCVKTRHEESSC